MERVYVLGKGRAPSWCRALLSPYSKANGQIGYEFRGADMNFDLSIGDKLVQDEHGRIKVIRQRVRQEE